MARFISIGTLVIFIVFGSIVAGAGESKPKEELSTLEGMLKVHPKFLYKYYIRAYGGQTCALYGDERAHEPIELKDIEPGTYIRVRGRLGTFLHEGGTKDNPSPFVQTWVIYMEVDEVTRLLKIGKIKKPSNS